jgi:hypothetical protein
MFVGDPNVDRFQERLKRVQSQHPAAPESRRRRSIIPWRLVLILLILYYGGRAGLMVQMGPAAYQAKVDELAAGEGARAWGGWLMAPDGVTVYLYEKFMILGAALREAGKA